MTLYAAVCVWHEVGGSQAVTCRRFCSRMVQGLTKFWLPKPKPHTVANIVSMSAIRQHHHVVDMTSGVPSDLGHARRQPIAIVAG
jgi:hypothetical protein